MPTLQLLTEKEQRGRAKQKIAEIREQEYDKPITAFATGALRGATLGLSDVGLSALGVADATREVRRQSPIASIAGEVTGAIGGMFTGAPAALAAQVAARTGQALGTSRVGQLAVGGATEGAFLGVGETISEAALVSPESAMEKAVANIGLGAAFGGVLNTSVPYAIEGIGRAVQGSLKLIDKTNLPKSGADFARLLGRQYGKAVNLSRADFEVDETSMKLWDKGSDEFRRQVLDNIKDPDKLNRTIEKRFNAVREFSDKLEKDSGLAARLQKEMIDDFDRPTQAVNEEGLITLSGKSLNRAEERVGSKQFEAAQRAGQEAIDEFDKILSQMKKDNDEFPGSFDGGVMREISIVRKDLVESLSKAKTIGEVSDALVKAKSQYGTRLPIFTRNMKFLETTNPTMYRTIQEARPLYGKLKGLSVDEKVFGELGSRLAERADALSTLRQGIQDFDKQFFDYVQQGGKTVRILNFQKMADFIKRTDLPRKEKQRLALSGFNEAVDYATERLKPLKTDKLKAGIENLEKFRAKQERNLAGFQKTDVLGRIDQMLSRMNKQLTQVDEFNAQMAKTIDDAKAKKKEFDEAMDFAQEIRSAVNWLNAKESFTGKSLHGVILGAGAGGLGSVFAETSPELTGALGFAGALGGALLASPRAGLKTLVAIEKAAEGLDRLADDAAKKFVRLGRKIQDAGEGVVPGVIKGGKQSIIKDNIRQQLQIFEKEQDDESAYQTHQEELGNLTADPVKLYENIFEVLGQDAAEMMPQSTSAMFETTVRASEFLKSKMPTPSFESPFLQQSYVPSFAELSKYAVYSKAVMKPKTIFSEMKEGTLRPETVEAIRAVYPSLYETVKMNVAEQLSTAKTIAFGIQRIF
jgi:septum formation inhibitor MinC